MKINQNSRNLKKVLENDPKNQIANYQIIRYKYGGDQRSFKLKNDENFYNQFDNDAQNLLREFPNSLRIRTYISNLYRY